MRLDLGHVSKSNAIVTFQQGVALHDFEMQVRKRLWFFFINHHCKPETEAGNVNCTFLDVDAIYTFLHYVTLDKRAVGVWFQRNEYA